MFNYYVKSKHVLEFDKWFNMVFGNKLKKCLPVKVLDYVLANEGNSVLTSEKIASLADIHSNNYIYGKYKGIVLTILDGRQDGQLSYKRYGNGNHGNQDSQSGVTRSGFSITGIENQHSYGGGGVSQDHRSNTGIGQGQLSHVANRGSRGRGGVAIVNGRLDNRYC